MEPNTPLTKTNSPTSQPLNTENLIDAFRIEFDRDGNILIDAKVQLSMKLLKSAWGEAHPETIAEAGSDRMIEMAVFDLEKTVPLLRQKLLDFINKAAQGTDTGTS